MTALTSHMSRVGLAAALLASSLAAASVASAATARRAGDPPPPQVRLPAAYQADLSTAAAATPDPAAPAQLDRWWTLFDDPRLDALEAEAFAGSPDIRTAQARIVEASAVRAARLAGTAPSGNFSGTVGRQVDYGPGLGSGNINSTSGAVDTAQGSFNISWEIDLFGRLKAQRRVARAQDAEARFDVEATRAALAAAVADSWFQVQGLAIQLDDAQTSARIAADLADIAKRRATAGAGPADEIDRTTAEAQAAQAQAADVAAQLEDARRQLLILIGRPLDDLERIAPLDGLPSVPATPRAVPGELLARRPDVREAQFHLLAQLGTATLAHRAIFPTLTLLPALGGSSISSPGVSYIPPSTLISQTQTTTTGFWSLAVGVSAPTLDIPRLLDQAHAEDARSRQAAIAYEKTVRTAFGEAQNALTDLSAGERASALLAASEGHAHAAYDASRRRYGAGMDDLTATLTAEQSWRRIHAQLTSERVDTLRRAVRTYKALGGGWAFSNGARG